MSISWERFPYQQFSSEVRRYESGWTHTQLVIQSTFYLHKTEQKAYDNTLISRAARRWETARRTSYLKLDKKPKSSQKSCCISMQHATPRRLNSNIIVYTYLFKAGIWPFQAHLFQQTLLRLEHQIIADNIKKVWQEEQYWFLLCDYLFFL